MSDPKRTAVVPVKYFPVMTTAVPPASGPWFGARPVTTGAGASYRYCTGAVVPDGVVTVTSTVPGSLPAGTVAVTSVSLTTVTAVAGTSPKWTADVPVRLLPLTVTVVPPAIGPNSGVMPVTAGGGLWYVNCPAGSVLPRTVSVTSTAPAACAGAVAVTVEPSTTVTSVAATPPKETAVAPVR